MTDWYEKSMRALQLAGKGNTSRLTRDPCASCWSS